MMKQKNGLEWAVFAVSLILTVGVLGVLTYEVVRFVGTPPVIHVRLEAVRPQGERFAIPVQVRNEGGGAAEEVRIEVVLYADGTAVERAQLTFARLPRNAMRKGWAVFTTDPVAGTLRAQVISYQTP